MRISLKVGSLILMPIFFVVFLSTYSQINYGILYENETCTNENITNSGARIINTTGTVDDFLKSLPSDNTILAEMVC